MEKLIFKKSIKLKFFYAILAITIPFLIILTFIEIRNKKNLLEENLNQRIKLKKENLIERGKTLSYQIVLEAENSISTLNFSNLSRLVENTVKNSPEVSYSFIYNKNDDIIIQASEDSFPLESYLNYLPIVGFLKPDSFMVIKEINYKENKIIEIISPIKVGLDVWGYLNIGFSINQLNNEAIASKNEIKERITNSIFFSILTTIFFIFLTYILAFWFTNKLSNPIINLTNLSKELAKGNFSVTSKLKVDTEDEVGVLSKSFIEMVDELNILYRKIENYTKELEEKVEERTKSLAEANAALKEANEKLKELSEVKSIFLANMSHEIRTPMNAIIGLAHLLQNTELNKKQKDYVDKISTSAQILLGIINDILDFSKIEAGKLEIEKINFNLEEIFSNISNMMSKSAESKDLELLFNIKYNTPNLLIGDPLRLQQILINLISNAIKFTEHGEIIILVEVEKKIDEKICLLKFSVKDTGIGITKENQNKLFESFSQVDSSITRKYGGTGLGLAICKKLVNLMGGEIYFESEYGKGSDFFFTIPFEIQESFSSENIKKNNLSSEVIVLVVDDNEVSLEILKSYLEDFGVKVETFNNGKDVIKFLEEKKYKQCILLIDWKMPELDGIETIKLIEKNEKINILPYIIMVSAYNLENVEIISENLPIAGFLTKPIIRSALYEKLNSIFNENDEEDKDIGKSFDDSKKLKFNKEKILLVEDNDINRQVAYEILKEMNLDVDTANDGEEAVKKVFESKYDLVFIDIHMPKLDGYEATRLIRKNKDYIDLPIIAMTADVMLKEKDLCLEAGMNDHIPKPIDIEYLNNILSKWLKKNKNTLEIIKKNNGYKDDNLLENIYGINYNKGLKRVLGNSKFYKKILIDFKNSYSNSPELIEKLFNNKKIEELEKYIHILKGVSGNISAEKIFMYTEKMEKILKEKNYNEFLEIFEEFKKEFTLLINDLNKISDFEVDIKKNNLNEEELTPALFEEILQKLNNLEIFLINNNFQASEEFERLKVLCKNIFKDEIKQLGKFIDLYDFDNSIIVLNKFKNKLKETKLK